jgi:ribonucleoside-diphosphate reductase alpha chain
MLPKTQDGRSGWQFCNLVESNGGKIVNRETLMKAAKAASILATLQAGYTNFKYLSKETKEITEREALIGVSITGWMNNPDVLFDEKNMQDAAKLVMQVNKQVAKLIGVNPAARTTCAKPSGNASVILGTGSGIHGEHSKQYFRNVQMNEMDEVLDVIRKINPQMVEKSVWSANGTDYVVSFPVQAKEGSITRSQLLGVKQLEYVKKAQQFWVEAGTDLELCVDKNLRHNISNTISVDNWDEVEQYLFDNRQWFAGVSLLSATGDKDYPQAPFTEVKTESAIVAEYGSAALFASGLVVDALHAFNDDLWKACSCVLGVGEKLDSENSEHLLKRDWVRRAKKFASNYFADNITLMTYCLKDVYNLHKWENVNRTMREIDFASQLQKVNYTDADSLAASGCAGGACEVTF